MVSATVDFPVRSMVTMASALASSSLVRSVSTSGGHFGTTAWGGGAGFLAGFCAAGAFALTIFFGAGLDFLPALAASLRAGVLIFDFALRGFAFFAALVAFFWAVLWGLLLALVFEALSLGACSFLALGVLDFLTALAFFFAGFFRGMVLLSNQGSILGRLVDSIKAIRCAACGWRLSFQGEAAW
jgi:hypothetical protein